MTHSASHPLPCTFASFFRRRRQAKRQLESTSARQQVFIFSEAHAGAAAVQCRVRVDVAEQQVTLRDLAWL